MPKRKYANSPIKEVVCEFKFSKDTPWDQTIAGLFFSAMKDSYPIKETRVMQQLQQINDSKGLGHQVNLTEYLVCLSENRQKMVQIAPRILSINCLRPYPDWDEYYNNIKAAFNCLKAMIEFKGFERIGLRYINQINLEREKVEIEEFFNFYPHIGPDLPQDYINFHIGYMAPFENERDLAKVQLSPYQGKQPGLNCVLDIDYSLADTKGFNIEETLSWVDSAHSRVYELFEGCITDELRQIVGEVK